MGNDKGKAKNKKFIRNAIIATLIDLVIIIIEIIIPFPNGKISGCTLVINIVLIIITSVLLLFFLRLVEVEHLKFFHTVILFLGVSIGLLIYRGLLISPYISEEAINWGDSWHSNTASITSTLDLVTPTPRITPTSTPIFFEDFNNRNLVLWSEPHNDVGTITTVNGSDTGFLIFSIDPNNQLNYRFTGITPQIDYSQISEFEFEMRLNQIGSDICSEGLWISFSDGTYFRVILNNTGWHLNINDIGSSLFQRSAEDFLEDSWIINLTWQADGNILLTGEENDSIIFSRQIGIYTTPISNIMLFAETNSSNCLLRGSVDYVRIWGE